MFDTDECIALCGLPDEDEAFDCLDAALAVPEGERALRGYRFRHRQIRDALLAAKGHRQPSSASLGRRPAPVSTRCSSGEAARANLRTMLRAKPSVRAMARRS
ncbi:hypothetical protein [Spirillospora sp. CA-128828]|uniref:hypothetical protein n=1 Tax=Spirillospora sp. CA-128828 TaxID=3240033 RepID=UPI003D93D499